MSQYRCPVNVSGQCQAGVNDQTKQNQLYVYKYEKKIESASVEHTYQAFRHSF